MLRGSTGKIVNGQAQENLSQCFAVSNAGRIPPTWQL
jgi:hypothetical protein